MHPYLIVLLCGVVLCAVIFSIRLRKQALPGKVALTALCLSAVLAFVLSKTVYVLALCSRLFPRYGMSAFLRMEWTEFSFVGGAVGVVLGVMMACRIHHVSVPSVLDAFAPAGALLMAFVRGGEYFLGMHGVGAYLENESLYFFPLAVSNEWEEYFLAVFMLSAIFALIAAVVSMAAGKKTQSVPGLLFELVLYHLALSQILGENLRVQCIKWGFVRAEQLLCALVCLGLLLRSCRAYPGKNQTAAPVSFVRRFWPIPALFACAGVLIMMEFALDGKIPMQAVWCYVIMIATLCLMSGLTIFAARRKLR